MYNCYKVFKNNRLFFITRNEIDAETLVNCFRSEFRFTNHNWRIEPAYIADTGF